MSAYLLDTNVVLRLIDRENPAHEQCRMAVEALITRGDEPCLAPQVLVEFWVVATRPKQSNGFGWDPTTAKDAIEGLRSQFSLRPEGKELFEEWLRLVTSFGVSGKRSHDARLAAFVSVYDLKAVVTLNPRDFNGLGIRVVEPDYLLTEAR